MVILPPPIWVGIDGAGDDVLHVVGRVGLGVGLGRDDLAVLDIDVANLAADFIGGIVNPAADKLDEHGFGLPP